MATPRDEAAAAGAELVSILVNLGVTESDFWRWIKDPQRMSQSPHSKL